MNLKNASTVSIFASHGLVLMYLSTNSEPTMRELAVELNLTERHVARILRDLSKAELISVTKRGNRNIYTINEDASCFHPSMPALRLGDLVKAVQRQGNSVKRAYEGISTKLTALLFADFSVAEGESLAILVPVLS